MDAPWQLIAIKLLHTIVWALLAGCIMAIPLAAFRQRFRAATTLIAIILGECLVLAANGGHCPMTDWAARFTTDRAANFDIYLPLWLAAKNKTIFGTLFVVNTAIVMWRWLVTRPLATKLK